jgi:hypothetical protein
VSDLLTLTVLTPVVAGRARYAGVNAISDHGAYHGKKSAEYLELFRAVREAARAEMERVGWVTWPHPCEVQVVRYHRTARMSDCGNLGKAEMDAMAPSTPNQEARDKCAHFPGVYLNDSLVRPYHASVEYDPDGPDRVVIIVRRRYPDIAAVVVPRKHRAVVPKVPRARQPQVASPSARAPKSERMALLGNSASTNDQT